MTTTNPTAPASGEHCACCANAGPLADVAEVWRTINSPEGFRPAEVRPLLDRIEQALRSGR